MALIMTDGTDFASRVARARAFYQSMLPDVEKGLRSQTDAEESAIRKVAEAGLRLRRLPPRRHSWGSYEQDDEAQDDEMALLHKAALNRGQP
jgi:hypothetical protein